MPFLGKTPSQFVDPEVDIDGGTIDGTSIGATSASTATVTTLIAEGNVEFQGDTSANAVGTDTAGTTAKLYLGTQIDQTGFRGQFTFDRSTDVLTYSNGSNAADTRITVNSDGNVGIGESSPAALTHISSSYVAPTGGISADTKLIVSNNNVGSGVVGISLLSRSNVQSRINFGSQLDEDNSYILGGVSQLDFGTNASTRMTIDSSGNVGIGDDSPTDQLSISKHSGNSIKLETFVGNINDSTFKFQKARGGSSGPSQIGTTDDLGTITWSGYDGSSFNQAAFIKAKASTNTGDFDASLSFGTSSEAMRIDASGNLLVGRTSGVGSERLAVQGAALVGTFYSANSTANGTLMSYYSDVGGTQQQVAAMQRDGDIFNANNTYGALSDERLKSNIVDASSQLDDIMAVQVRSYTLNSTGDTHIGVVAQELEASGMSGLVSEDEDGMKSVKYSVLYMKAIKAIQEQQAIIEDLQTRLSALEAN